MNFKSIPDDLKNLDQWVSCYKDSKIPMRSFAFKAASSSNQYTWSSFDQAVKSVQNHFYEYIGFVFDNNGLVGIDIDDAYDADGFISDKALDIINHCKSYTEKSKSGKGFHIILKGDLPFKGKANRKGLEIYKDDRFFIITGDVIMYKDIKSDQQAIDYVLSKYFADKDNQSDDAKDSKLYQPVWSDVIHDGKVKLLPDYPVIGDGSRNMTLTSLAGYYYQLGYSKDNLLDELLKVNSIACDPPLKEYEVTTIVNSIFRYKR